MTQPTTIRIRIKRPLDEEDEPRLGRPSTRVDEPEDRLPSGVRYQPLWGRIITTILALVGIVVVALALLVPREDQAPQGPVAKGPATESPVTRVPELEKPAPPIQPPLADTARITPAPAPATTEQAVAGIEPAIPIAPEPGQETPPPSSAVPPEAGEAAGTASLQPPSPGQERPDVPEAPEPEPLAGGPEPVSEAPAEAVTPPPTNGVSAGIAPPPTAEAPRPDLPYRVARAQFTSGIRAREPMDRLGPVISPSASGSTGVYYFTELRDMQGHTATHRWEHEGHTIARVRFPVRGRRWRIYSSKVLPSAMQGEWRVTVTDEQGRVLRTDGFRYE